MFGYMNRFPLRDAACCTAANALQNIKDVTVPTI
jgi:hypothetical protein